MLLKDLLFQSFHKLLVGLECVVVIGLLKMVKFLQLEVFFLKVGNDLFLTVDFLFGFGNIEVELLYSFPVIGLNLLDLLIIESGVCALQLGFVVDLTEGQLTLQGIYLLSSLSKPLLQITLMTMVTLVYFILLR